MKYVELSLHNSPSQKAGVNGPRFLYFTDQLNIALMTNNTKVDSLFELGPMGPWTGATEQVSDLHVLAVVNLIA